MGEGERVAGNIPRLSGVKRKAEDDGITSLPKRPALEQQDARPQSSQLDRILSLTARDLENGNFRKAAANLNGLEKSRLGELIKDSPLAEVSLALNRNIRNAEMRHHEMVEASKKLWPKVSEGEAVPYRKYPTAIAERALFWRAFRSAAAGARFLDEDRQMEIANFLLKSGPMGDRAAHACNACEYMDDFKEKPRSKLLAMAINLFPHAQRKVQLRVYEQVSRARHEGYLNEGHLDFIDRTGNGEGMRKYICREVLEYAAGTFQDSIDRREDKNSAAVMATEPLFSKAAEEIDPMGHLDKAQSSLRDVVRHQERQRDVGR